MSRQAGGRGPGAGGRLESQPKHGAASSHAANDAYMEDFERAYAELEALSIGTPANASQPGAHGTRPPAPGHDRRSAGASASLEAGRLVSPGVSRPEAAHPKTASRPARGAAAVATTLPDRYPGAVSASWQSGPTAPEGTLCDLSDRPISCSAAHWGRGEVVLGCTDHALYILDPLKGTRKRTLYSKTAGHSEWVTCCTFLPDGQVASGGMDSKLWLWPAGGVRGRELSGHGGPVSKVAYDAGSGRLVSCSYDKSVRVWDVGRGQEVGQTPPHAAPVLELDVSPDSLLLTGDRSGNMQVCDGGTCEMVWALKRVHGGHVTALAWFDYSTAGCAGCFASGGQDGRVRVWDPRDHSCVTNQVLHANREGAGAVGGMAAGGPAATDLLVTMGADRTLCVTDPRASFALLYAPIQLSDFPYSLAVAGGLALVGCGDGSLWVVHLGTGTVRYCLGANKHAVRCLEASSDVLVAAGDDGKAITWHFT